MFLLHDELTLHFQSLKVGRIRKPTFQAGSWSGGFRPELPAKNSSADRLRDYILAAQLFALQLGGAADGRAPPPEPDALSHFVDLLWSAEWCVLSAGGRLMALATGPFWYPDGTVTWREQPSSAVG